MVELVITMDEHGAVNVTGPLDQRVLCYGMLEVAKEVIAQLAAHKTKEAPRIVPALGPLIPPRGGRGQ